MTTPITPILPLEAKMEVWGPLGYVPSEWSLPFHMSEAHERYLFGGWRAGKSFTAAMEFVPLPLCWIHHGRRDGLSGLIWIVGVQYSDAEREFEYFEDAYSRLGYLKTINKPKDSQWSLTTSTGWLIETKTASDLTKLGGKTVNAMIIAEPGRHHEGIRTWAFGRTNEQYGSIVLPGTLEEAAEWFADKYYEYQHWPNKANIQCFSLPSWSNTQEYNGPNDPKIVAARNALPHNVFLARYRGIPAPPSNVVFPEFRSRPGEVTGFNPDDPSKPICVSAGEICHVSELAEHHEHLPVVLMADPGTVYAVLACHWVTFRQPRRDTGEFIHVPGIYVFDEVYLPRGSFDRVRDILLDKPYFKNIEVATHDRATDQHHNQKSQADLWSTKVEHGGLGLTVQWRKEILHVGDGISMLHRWLLNPLTGLPLVFFNPRCKHAIREYAKEKYPKDRSSSNAKVNPIDRNNHARKALTYGIYFKHGLKLPYEEKVDAALARARTVKSWAYGF